MVPCGILSNRSSGLAVPGVIRAELGDPMTEILTESFCERCGTRYTFESARPRARLKGVKVLSRGLKNFVMSDDSSIDEAMAAARSDTDREATAHQLDAFHKTFNFCMSCRQYTCPNCWNEAEARCLTCAPHLGQEVMPAPFPDLVTSSYLVADPIETVVANGSNGSNGIAYDAVVEPDQTSVDTADFATRLQALMAPPTLEEPADTVAEAAVAEAAVAEAEAVATPPDAIETATEADEVAQAEELAQTGPVAEVEGAADVPVALDVAVVAAQVEAIATDAEPLAAEVEAIATEAEPLAAETEPVAAAEAAISDDSDGDAEIAARLAAWSAAAVAFDAARDDAPATEQTAGEKGAAQTGGLLRRFRAGQSLDAELDAYEADQLAPVADELEPAAPVDAAAPDVEAIAAAAEIAAFVAEPEAEAEAIVAPEAGETTAPEAEETSAQAAGIAAVAAEPEPEPVAQPELVAEAELVAEPELVTEPELVAEPEPVAAEPAPPIDDVIAQPTWQRVAPDPAADLVPAAPVEPSLPAAATLANPPAEPQWPARPEWPGGVSPAAGLPFLNRPPAPTGGLEALWAESAREVVAPPTVAGRPVATGGIQPCVSCGLSLSATARFCRRCGTPQAL